MDHACLPQKAPTKNPKITLTAEINTAMLQPPKIPCVEPEANKVPLIKDSTHSKARRRK